MIVVSPDWVDIDDKEGPKGHTALKVIFAELVIDWKKGVLEFSKNYGVVLSDPNGISFNRCQALAESYADGAKPNFLDGDDGVEMPAPAVRNAKKILTTPFDIVPKYQCWLIISLPQDKARWQFAKDAAPITVKRTDLLQVGDNCYLRHVYPSGVTNPRTQCGPVKEDKCSVAFFGIAARRKNEPQRFNFHTEFVQKHPKGKPDHHMVVIFDPDIPDDGHDAIP